MKKSLLVVVFNLIIVFNLIAGEGGDSSRYIPFKFLHEDSVWVKRADSFTKKLKKVVIDNDVTYLDSVIFNKANAVKFLEMADIDSLLYIDESDTILLTPDTLSSIIIENAQFGLKEIRGRFLKDTDISWRFIMESSNYLEGITLITLYMEFKNDLYQKLSLPNPVYSLNTGLFNDNLFFLKFQ